jgi:GntR family transcriptional regulator, transcriptional repressor for pyruvate dehydrogenase complex
MAAQFAIDRVQPSYAQVAAQLRTLIVSGQLQPGQRLPAEKDLARQFGVSRSTVREALRVLAAEQLVTMRRGSAGGTFVVHPDPQAVERTLKAAVSLAAGTERLSMHEVFEMWRLTHVPSAVLAARRRTDEQATQLMELSEPLGSGAAHDEWVHRSLQFHDAVVDAASNRLLSMCVRPLAGVGVDAVTPTATTQRFFRQANSRHRRIAIAIAERDEIAASLEMTRDMDMSPEFHGLANGELSSVASPISARAAQRPIPSPEEP